MQFSESLLNFYFALSILLYICNNKFEYHSFFSFSHYLLRAQQQQITEIFVDNIRLVKMHAYRMYIVYISYIYRVYISYVSDSYG